MQNACKPPSENSIPRSAWVNRPSPQMHQASSAGNISGATAARPKGRVAREGGEKDRPRCCARSGALAPPRGSPDHLYLPLNHVQLSFHLHPPLGQVSTAGTPLWILSSTLSRLSKCMVMNPCFPTTIPPDARQHHEVIPGGRRRSRGRGHSLDRPPLQPEVRRGEPRSPSLR